MNNNICFKYAKWQCLLWSIAILMLSGCSQNEIAEEPDRQIISVPVEITGLQTNKEKSIETQPYTVNRVLLLPFKKIDEGISANNESNFAPDYTAARQVNVNALTSYMTMLNLSANSTYKILVIGYNQNDYNFNDQSNVNNKFSLGSVSNPTLLNNIQLLTKSAASVPEFFIATCQSYNNTNVTGEYFKPPQIKTLKGNLTRLVSGLNIEITDIPTYITSITLVAEKLVKGIQPVSTIATVVQSASDADNLKTFSTQIPASAKVSFNHYLLPTLDINKTKLYLDIKYGIFTERYIIKVPDTNGVLSGNSITFSPNHVVKISGNYSNINIGFVLSYSINLDDDNWDGIQ